MASWKGAAHVNSAWKNRNITRKKTIVPHTGCNRTLSMRSVRASGWGSWCPALARVESTHPVSSSAAVGGGMGGRLQVCHSLMR